MANHQLVFDNKELIGAWVATKTEQVTTWGDFYAMGVMQGDEVIAGVVFNNFNGANATCHIAVEKPGKSMIKLLQAAYYYAFNQCKLKRLTGMVPTSEPHVLAFDQHLGWEYEFTMKDAHPTGDMVVLVMTPESGKRWRTC
jgi:hypothetical protein